MVRPTGFSQLSTSWCRPEQASHCIAGGFLHTQRIYPDLFFFWKASGDSFLPEEMWQEPLKHHGLQILGNFKGRTFCLAGKQLKDKEALKLSSRFPGTALMKGWLLGDSIGKLKLGLLSVPTVIPSSSSCAAQPGPLPPLGLKLCSTGDHWNTPESQVLAE